MQLDKVFLWLLLVALGGAWWLERGARPKESVWPGDQAASTVVVTQVVRVTNAVGQAVGEPFHWRQLESEDYPTFIGNLRAIGCPEQTIRDIVVADLDLLWAPRVGAVVPRHGEWKYWQSEEEALANDHDARVWERAERVLEREKREVLRELLGLDLVSERLRLAGKADADAVERRLRFLPADKRMEVREVVERYGQEEKALLSRVEEEGVSLDAGARERLRQLRAERDAALGRVLTPEERGRYDLSLSATAEAVRRDMYGMNATEEEFRAVYALRKAFDERWPVDELNLQDPERAARFDAARQELQRKIGETLGEERLAAYERGCDQDFHLLNRTVSRYGLDKQKAETVYEFKRLMELEQERVMTNTAWALNQREAALRAMNDELRVAVKEVLGENAYNYFRRKSGWLR